MMDAENQLQTRKPIYDDPSLDTAAGSTIPGTPAPPKTSSSLFPDPEHRPHGPTPTDRLAGQIRGVRLFLYDQSARAEDALNRTMSRAFDLEQSFTSTIASLAPPRESGERLMPGVLYVLVAAMAGSIATRRSNILLRAAVPIAFGVGTANVVLPITSANVGRLAWKYEERVPVVAEAHKSTAEGIRKGVHFAQVHGRLGADWVSQAIGQARNSLEGWVRKGN
jgi:MICOS complex subunit MIC26